VNRLCITRYWVVVDTKVEVFLKLIYGNTNEQKVNWSLNVVDGNKTMIKMSNLTQQYNCVVSYLMLREILRLQLADDQVIEFLLVDIHWTNIKLDTKDELKLI